VCLNTLLFNIFICLYDSITCEISVSWEKCTCNVLTPFPFLIPLSPLLFIFVIFINCSFFNFFFKLSIFLLFCLCFVFLIVIWMCDTLFFEHNVGFLVVLSCMERVGSRCVFFFCKYYKIRKIYIICQIFFLCPVFVSIIGKLLWGIYFVINLLVFLWEYHKINTKI